MHMSGGSYFGSASQPRRPFLMHSALQSPICYFNRLVDDVCGCQQLLYCEMITMTVDKIRRIDTDLFRIVLQIRSVEGERRYVLGSAILRKSCARRELPIHDTGYNRTS